MPLGLVFEDGLVFASGDMGSSVGPEDAS
jgi:hypothetical protein